MKFQGSANRIIAIAIPTMRSQLLPFDCSRYNAIVMAQHAIVMAQYSIAAVTMALS
jgi:hypothetical protein